MHCGQNREKQKRRPKLKQNVIFSEIGGMYKFLRNNGEFPNFLKIGEKYAIIGLWGMDALIVICLPNGLSKSIKNSHQYLLNIHRGDGQYSPNRLSIASLHSTAAYQLTV